VHPAPGAATALAGPLTVPLPMAVDQHFLPRTQTCTPALTTCLPGAGPWLTTASSAAAAGITTGCDRTVPGAGSNTLTVQPCASCFNLLLGNLINTRPFVDKACGNTVSVDPSAGSWMPLSATLTR